MPKENLNFHLAKQLEKLKNEDYRKLRIQNREKKRRRINAKS